MRHQDDRGTLDLITGGLILGYARVSTDDQDLTNQRAELHAAGWPCWISRSNAGNWTKPAIKRARASELRLEEPAPARFLPTRGPQDDGILLVISCLSSSAFNAFVARPPLSHGARSWPRSWVENELNAKIQSDMAHRLPFQYRRIGDGP